MRIALYIEDGLEQIVLTPESDTERGILRKLNDSSRSLTIARGEFYGNRAGYVRHGIIGERPSDRESTMIVLRSLCSCPEGTCCLDGDGTFLLVGISCRRRAAALRTP